MCAEDTCVCALLGPTPVTRPAESASEPLSCYWCYPDGWMERKRKRLLPCGALIFFHSLTRGRAPRVHTHPIHFHGNNFHFSPARYGDLRHRSTSLISARSIGRCCGDFASVRCSLSVGDGKQLVAVALRLQHRGGAARVQGGGPQGPQTAAGPRRRVRRHWPPVHLLQVRISITNFMKRVLVGCGNFQSAVSKKHTLWLKDYPNIYTL